MNRILPFLRKFESRISRPEVFYYTLFWLMYLVVAGTLAQRSMGLYQAQQKYFSTLFFMLGPVPLPGAYLVMGVIFFGLLSKLVFHGNWTRKNLGVNVTHIGAILLLLGGFLTAAFSREGSMAIAEGETLGAFTDYHELEFAVIDTSQPDRDTTYAFSEGWLKPGSTLTHPELPFKLEVLEVSANTEVQRRTTAAPEDARGFMKIFALKPAPLDKEEYKNQGSVVFRLSDAGAPNDGLYGVFEQMPVGQTLKTPNRQFRVEIRKARTRLPFTIHLIDFRKENHPSTDMAKSYSSVVEVTEGGITQRSLIQMNEPLRYRGYTLYQSSFAEEQGKEISVFAVVKNAGAMFPYISSLIMCFGLLIHLVSKLPDLIAGKGRAK